ncbi:mitochondrial splicing system protein [Diplodia seriata]|uniref:Mitochondrial splicing system protein n=1 Tax=Diplodia seriata TaxID=420778 RepID=A0ABR3CIX2_9PEZI
MLLKTLVAAFTLAGTAFAQRPADVSICDYYTSALFKNNTAENQLTHMTLLVNTVVIGNYTKPTIDGITWPDVTVPGILANGTIDGKNVSLLPKLLTHLYSFFGALLGCGHQSTDPNAPFPVYAGNPSQHAVHKYMNLSAAEFTYFVTQVGLAARSFGVGEKDITAVGKALNDTFGVKCSANASVVKGQPAAEQAIYHALCPGKPLPQPRHAALRTLYDPTAPSPPPQSAILDSALVLFFRGPYSVTGEDLLELHVHGGPAIVRAVLSSIPKCSPPSRSASKGGGGSGPHTTTSIRYAEPGEFTRRAYLNSRLSLPQVEALGDALTAATEQQRLLSVRGSASSRLAARYDEWRRALLLARGELEALIDFAEDQHFDESPAQLAASVAAQARALRAAMDAHARNAVRGELLRGGISVALLGEPNAGKSSLLNRVVGREAAIVSQERGTTRDVVETGVDLGGWFCRIGDTAGLRGAGVGAGGRKVADVGAVEMEGIRRAKERAIGADVVVCVFSVEEDPRTGLPGLSLSPEVVETARECMSRGGQVMAIVNKSDMLPLSGRAEEQRQHLTSIRAQLDLPPERIHFISCKEAAAPSSTSTSSPDPGNLQSFLSGLVTIFKEMTTPVVPELDGVVAPDMSIWQESLGATERQRLLLEECSAHLTEFLREVEEGEAEMDGELDIVLAAESLRAAATCLAKITGKGEAGDVEEVLGVVFEK